jgi:hypothetical protein
MQSYIINDNTWYKFSDILNKYPCIHISEHDYNFYEFFKNIPIEMCGYFLKSYKVQFPDIQYAHINKQWFDDNEEMIIYNMKNWHFNKLNELNIPAIRELSIEFNSYITYEKLVEIGCPFTEDQIKRYIEFKWTSEDEYCFHYYNDLLSILTVCEYFQDDTIDKTLYSLPYSCLMNLMPNKNISNNIRAKWYYLMKNKIDYYINNCSFINDKYEKKQEIIQFVENVMIY